MTRRLWLARHGHRLDYADLRWRTTAPRADDPPLSAEGVLQGRELAARLRGSQIAQILSSPFLRTVETAHHVAEALGLRVKIEPGMSEWMRDDWFDFYPELLSTVELAARFPRLDPDHPPSASPRFPESLQDMLARTSRTIHRLLGTYPGDLFVVGHAASVVGTTVALVPDPPELNPAMGGLITLACRGGCWSVEHPGDVSHLSRPTEDPPRA